MPIAHCNNWPIWTCDFNSVDGQILSQVEDSNNNDNNEEGWVNPNSFHTLFLPSDLPIPLARQAVGIVMANGSPSEYML